jgi:hypothetical protein
MIPSYRKYIPKIYTVIAFILIPTTLFLSSGSTFNNAGFSQSMSLKVNTLPAFSNIKIGNYPVGNFSSDIKILDGVTTNINLNKDGYLSENWDIYAPKNQNSILNLDPLYLLPINSLKLESDFQFLTILDTNIAMAKKEDKFFIVNYDITGIKNAFQLKENFNYSGSKSIQLDGRSYYLPNSNIVITNLNDEFKVINLSELFVKTKKVFKTTDNEIIILTDDNKVFTYNIINKNLTFAYNQCFDGQESKETNFTFLLCDIGIVQLNKGNILSSDNFNQQKVSFKLPLEGIIKDLYQKNNTSFKITTSSIGTVLLINNNLYINQEGLKEWKSIENAVIDYTTFDSKILFFNNNKLLKLIDVNDQFIYPMGFFDQIESLDDLKVVFYQPWSRIMLINPNSISSIHYSQNYLPNLITTPSTRPQISTWITNQNCFDKIINKSQVCIENGNLNVYRNVSFLPTI